MTKLYVGNLPGSMDESAVRELFEKHGVVKSIALIRDRNTGRPRNFGFVEMGKADAKRAIDQLNGVEVGESSAEEGGTREFLGFAEEFRAPDQPVIEPERFAGALHLQLQDLAKLAGVHRSTVTENPTNAKLQGFLRDALRVLSAAYEVTNDRDRAIFWFRNTPISDFNHRTAEQLVVEGKTDSIIAYLASIASGSSG